MDKICVDMVTEDRRGNNITLTQLDFVSSRLASALSNLEVMCSSRALILWVSFSLDCS